MKKVFLGLALASSCLLFYPTTGHAQDTERSSQTTTQSTEKGKFNPEDPFFPIAPTKEDLENDKIKPGDIPLEEEDLTESLENRSKFRSSSSLSAKNSEIIKKPLATIVQDYAPEFPKFGYGNGVGKPRGIVIHETANNQSTIFNEIAFMRRNYNSAFVQAFVDADNIIEIHPTDYASWGSGRYGNAHFIQIELVEHPENRDKFYRSINNQAYYSAYLLKKYGLTPSRADDRSTSDNPIGTIWGHFEVSSLLGGTDHGDPLGYYRQFGYTFSEFFELVSYHFNHMKDIVSGHNVLPGNGTTVAVKGGSYPIYSDIPFVGKNEVVLDTTNIAKTAIVKETVTTSKDRWAKVQIGKITGWVSQKVLQNGWIKAGNTWTYLDENFTVATGFKFIKDNTFYFNESGHMLTGWQKINNQYYYFSSLGAMLKGWIQDRGNWYYADSNGQMLTGWQNLGGHRYYFDISGKMATGLQTSGQKLYGFGTNGYQLTGWQTIQNKRYYFDPANSGAALTGQHKLNGKSFLFNSDGSLITKTGLQHINGKDYFINADYSLFIGQKIINGKTYFFTENGTTTNSGWVTVNGGKNYLENGKPVKGWKYISNKWYYFKNDGLMKTGWLSLNSKWYYLYSDGHLSTNEWIHPATNNDWFLSKANGELAIGLTKSIKNTYYFGHLGNMLTGWQRTGSTWYYFDASGKQVSNKWLKVNKHWYYFYADGKMAKNTTIDGYKLNNSGTY